jgi:hypothetical protein
VAVITLTSVIATGCIGATIATSRAQAETTVSQAAPDSAALQRKVEALEKQVEHLKKQVEELKQTRSTLRFLPTQPNLTLPLQRWQTVPAEPPPGTPFQFNGRTYYRSLLESKAQPGTGATVNPSEGGLLVLPATPSLVVAPAAGSK